MYMYQSAAKHVASSVHYQYYSDLYQCAPYATTALYINRAKCNQLEQLISFIITRSISPMVQCPVGCDAHIEHRYIGACKARCGHTKEDKLLYYSY
eukprot:3035-Heterococcus_DN1.PRE.1